MKKDGEVPQRAVLEVDVQFNDTGLSFIPNIPRSEMTSDELRDYDEKTVLVVDGLPTDLFMRILSNWPKRFVMGMIATVQSVWDGGEEKAALDKEQNLWTLEGYDRSLCNQAIVGALSVNEPFWGQYWLSSHRGGKTIFDLNLPVPAKYEADPQAVEPALV